jgi:hypothetical protein
MATADVTKPESLLAEAVCGQLRSILICFACCSDSSVSIFTILQAERLGIGFDTRKGRDFSVFHSFQTESETQTGSEVMDA